MGKIQKSIKQTNVKQNGTKIVKKKDRTTPKKVLLDKSVVDEVTKTEENDNDTLIGSLLKPPKELILDINDDYLKSGLKALIEYQKKSTKKSKNDVFGSEKPIFLQITCVKIPSTPIRHIRLTLKHSLITDKTEVCLIVTDLKRGRKVDHEPTVQSYEDLLRSKGVTCIQRVLPLHQLKAEYSQYEMKRRLCAHYDHFLVDAAASGLVAHFLGNSFREKRKMPVPVRLSQSNKDLAQTINEALYKTQLDLGAKGNTFSLQIGHTCMSLPQLFENLKAVAEELTTVFPGGWNNIRALYVKTDLSVAIPVYMTLKRSSIIDVPIQRNLRPKKFRTVSGELGTRKVTVYPSGDVQVSKMDKDENQDEQ